MKSINKILIVFFIFSFLTVYGAWRFIHSSKFSEQASNKVSQILTKKIGAKLSFSGVDFNIFPPSTIFKNVRIEKFDPLTANVGLDVEYLQVSFTYGSFFSNELQINDLILANGVVKVAINDKKESKINWKELSTRKFFEEYLDVLKQSPVQLNLVKASNIKAYIDNSYFNLHSLSIAPHRKELRAKINATDIRIDAEIKGLPPIELSRASALLELNKNEWKIESLQIEQAINKVDIKASLFNENNFLNAAINANYSFNIEQIIQQFPSLPVELKTFKGLASGSVATNGSVADPDIDLVFLADEFKSDWIQLERINGQLRKKKNILTLEKFEAKNNSEKYVLSRPFAFFDLKKKFFIALRASLVVQNAFTNTFLYAISNTLEEFKAYISGKVDVVWDGEKVHFQVKEKAQVKDFKLNSLTRNQPPILSNKGFSLEDAVFSLDKNLVFNFIATARMPGSKILTSGIITDKDLKINVKDSYIDMEAFGPISGVKIKGAGAVSVDIYGPFDNVKFDFDTDLNNFGLLDLNFGSVKSKFSLYLKSLQIMIHELEGKYKQSSYDAVGLLNFEDDSGMDLKIDFKSSTFSDAKEMYHLVFKNLKLPVEPEFVFSASYTIKGGYSVESLDIDGFVKGTDLKIAGEEAERLNFAFGLKNNLLTFSNIKINKARGEINSNVSVNLANNYVEMEGAVSGFRLRDFNFYKRLNLEYDGDLLVDFDGNGTVDDFSSRFKTRLVNPFIANIPASGSSAIFYINTDAVTVNANLLAGKIRLDSVADLKSRTVSLKGVIDTSDVREVLGAVAGHNMAEKSITGKIRGRINTQFDLDTLAIKSLLMELAQFNIIKGDINLAIDPKHNRVVLEDGIVKNWNLKFVDGDGYFISKAKNLSPTSFVFNQNFSLKTNVLELFIGSIDKIVGNITGENQIVVDKNISVEKFNLHGVKNSLKIKQIPGAITDLDYSIIKRGNLFEISNFTGKYGEGNIKVSGFFMFDDLYPEANIDYKIERSTIPLFKRSHIVASSTGKLTGSDLPYKLSGNISLLHGEILEDPAEFGQENKVSLDNLKKYLPQKSGADKASFLTLNFNFDTLNQIAVKNNLAEVYLKGSGTLAGDVLSPEINANVAAITPGSKFKFKGHDFVLKDGSMAEIKERGKIKTSELKFSGIAKINEYDVSLNIAGTMEKPLITLSSEPNLAQEELVSLLTLGVTSDISKNLEAKDRSSVTTLSLTTLLIDQLKINEDLNSTLGIKFSVQPEFREDETSLIQGKSAVSDSSANRLKTATRIKVNKQINKAVDVSVSSTVGGSIEQTQEMNVNYYINKAFSIEGVYEVKPSEEESTNTPNSIGADIKYRWSF